MTLEELRIEVAKACGWEFERRITNAQGESWDVYRRGNEVGSAFTGTMPDYANDLNACAEMEKAIPDEDRERYICNLIDVQQPGFPTHIATAVGKRGCFGLLQSTAAQRAEAFLRTLNLWKEEA